MLARQTEQADPKPGFLPGSICINEIPLKPEHVGTMAYDVIQHSQKLSALVASETAFAVITLVSIRGSAPQVVGAKAIATESGLESGTVGGGKIEAAALKHAQSMLTAASAPACELVTWNLQTDIGMTCGGEVQLLFEVHRFEAWHIAVFGAGHVAQVLVPMLLQLHCKVTCVDPRPEWVTRIPDHPKLRKICIEDPRTMVDALPDTTFFLLVSQGHATDLPVLAEILSTREAPYIGVIGSPQKASVLQRDLAAKGIPREKIASFFCPVGLPLGNNTPAEISISVIAQMVQERDRLQILSHKVKDF